MEKHREPDHWYRFDRMNVNLSKLTDEELDRFSQHHEVRDNALHEAARSIAHEYQARSHTAQEVLQFFGMNEVIVESEV